MKIPIDMPLDQKGRLTCITCHSYHAEFWDTEYNNEALLRRSKGKKLCFTCHKKF
jgi:predicted CXXCH cytochrome family protein